MIKAGIVGATGYTGGVLTDLLWHHPELELVALTSKSHIGKTVSEIFPHLRVAARYVEYCADALSGCDVAFVCYPHAEAHPVVAELVDAGVRVVDLSADFRLKETAAYGKWYGFEHPRPDLVSKAVFGLPEKYRADIANATIVANPGCYPTAMLLGLLPLAKDIDPGGVVVDAKSGVSGAGKTPSRKTHFCEVAGDFKAYSEVGHRHTSEMVQELSLAAGREMKVVFTPHLLPVDRGIFTSSYVRMTGDVGDTEALLASYRQYYAQEPFVEVCDHVPGLTEVVGTNFCRMTVRLDPGTGLVKVFAAIDNLVKGASGQAVQNMNCMFGIPENSGLGRKV